MSRLTPLLLVQGLHIFAGLAWGGGRLQPALGVWPALLRLSASDARRTLTALEVPVGRSQMLFGTTAIVLGVLRASPFGPLRSWDAVASTDYGHTCVIALVLTVVLAIRGARTHHLHNKVFDADAFHPRARSRLLFAHATDAVLVVSVIACMVMLHYGL